MITCENSGHNAEHDFPEVRKIVEASCKFNNLISEDVNMVIALRIRNI